MEWNKNIERDVKGTVFWVFCCGLCWFSSVYSLEVSKFVRTGF